MPDLDGFALYTDEEGKICLALGPFKPSMQLPTGSQVYEFQGRFYAAEEIHPLTREGLEKARVEARKTAAEYSALSSRFYALAGRVDDLLSTTFVT